MKEYWNKPDKTAEVFHLDSQGQLWFRTGDVTPALHGAIWRMSSVVHRLVQPTKMGSFTSKTALKTSSYVEVALALLELWRV